MLHKNTLHKFFVKEKVKELGRVWKDSQDQAYSLVDKTSDNGGTSLLIQWLELQGPNAAGLGSIPGQGSRSHMLQLRPSAAG